LSSRDQSDLERLFRRKIDLNSVSTQAFNRELCGLSFRFAVKISVLVDRSGSVQFIIIGDERLIFFPELKNYAIAPNELRGLRLIQTVPKPEPITRQDLADLALLRLDLILKIEIDENGYPGKSHLAHLKPHNLGKESFEIYPPFAPGQLDLDFPSLIHALEEELARARPEKETKGQEGVILVKVVLSKKKGAHIDKWQVEQEVSELKALARSAGVMVMDAAIQQREKYHSRYLVGEGKLEDLTVRAMQYGAETLVFDHELSPAQIQAIEEYTGLKVIDRTQLILDIFAQRAQSREGKIQVELAQYKYLLPRLVGRGVEMSRLVGGIGTRGPGETKLEVDRRRIRARISRLERELDQVRKSRSQRRFLRQRRNVPVVSIVGYTNAGKSTLLNHLTESHVAAEDRLFATLDPSSRRLRFPRERELIITDTVGFIRSLPKDLFTAFRATLEELEDADLLIHIADASSPELDMQISTVGKILEELGLSSKPIILALNKIDLVDEPSMRALQNRFPEAALVSALDRDTFMPMLMSMEEKLWSSRTEEAEAWRSLGYSGRG
jgi:GTP-binding protein HflX